jgi:small subunit ribosomal protein S9|tara:strand:- start:3492 stop:3890 length:399 start_codon:yes stop_codon:yes gene_type:complete
MSKKGIYWSATGRRKTSKASVRLTKGSGKIIINNCDYNEYFGRDISKMIMKQPLDLAGAIDQYDIYANVKGGGLSGQAGAVRLGIARILIQIDSDLRTDLKKAGMLTRDSREVERKKYGQPGARKKFQFSKR